MTLLNATDFQRRWNTTERCLTDVRRIDALISERAAWTPERIVSVADIDGSVMTFGDLERRANVVASRLMSLGVRRGEYVLVDLERDNSVLVAWLAVLKTGAAFIPLDPEDLSDKFMRLSGLPQVRFAVTGPEVSRPLQQRGLRVLSISLAALDAYEGPVAEVSCQDGPDVPAYAIATSGSTGTPKCVEVTHRPLFNLIDWAQREFDFRPSDRGLWVSPASFDLSIFDLLGLPALGSSVHLVTTKVRRDPGALAKVLAQQPVTFWNSAPALLLSLVPFLKAAPKTLSTLRTAFLSGDFIPLSLPSQIHALVPDLDFVALGGATEATIWSNVFHVGSVDPAWQSIPYGRPIQNARYYVLDVEGAPVGPRESGELYIGGACLARGYLGDPVLTDERFLPDPFASPPARMYRTGDLARIWEDGTIEILGRTDLQVKVSGYRVHLCEVESAMRQAGLDPCAAVAVPGPAKSHRIAAAIDAAAPPETEWRPRLEAMLPRYMVPDPVLRLATLPLTSTGKIDRKAISDRIISHQSDPAPPVASAPTEDAMLVFLRRAVAEMIGGASTLDADAPLGQLGLGSLEFAMIAGRLFEEHGLTINPVLFYEAGTLRLTARMIVRTIDETHWTSARPFHSPPESTSRILAEIAGISFQLPGAADLDQLWEVLESGKNCIGPVPNRPKRWLDPSKRAGFVEDIDCFDASFFRITPREAALLDPRQRLLLQSAWSAIEDAGVDPRSLEATRVGVFVGATGDDFSRLSHQRRSDIGPHTLTGVSPSLLANRISFVFGLTGPSECVDTACSSSLVALHRAVTALRNGECTSALVCGISLMLDRATDDALTQIGMLSPSNACRTFDAEADGYARGEGVVAVYLTPPTGGVTCRARILASSVNHNGRGVSLTAPTPSGQSDVIARGLQQSGIDPDTIGMVEAHGTGTSLGDPIEVKGLIDGFNAASPKSSGARHCALGSIKATIGHLEAAAGLAGVVRAIASASRGLVPAAPGFERLNPNISLDGSRFFIPRETQIWPAATTEDGFRRCSVSSFGFGGTNAHIILECASDKARYACRKSAAGAVALPISARDPETLRAYAARYEDYFSGLGRRGMDDFLLHRVARSAQDGRSSFDHRAVVIADTLDGARAGFQALREGSARNVVLQSICDPALAGAAETWAGGGSASWPESDVLPIPVPTYPFRRDRHWPDWGDLAETALPHEIDLAPYAELIAQHRIHDAPMIPAALFLMLLLDTAEGLAGGPYRVLEAVRLRSNIVGGDVPDRLVVRTEPYSDGWRISIGPRDADIPYCSALARTVPAATGPFEWNPRAPVRSWTRAQVYARFRDIGARFGPLLNVAREAEQSDDGCRIMLRSDAKGLCTFPSLLDGGFQAALLYALLQGDEGGIPACIDRVTRHHPLSLPTDAIARRAERPDRVDVHLCNEAGAVLDISGLRGLPLQPSPAQICIFERRYRPVVFVGAADPPRLVPADPKSELAAVLGLSSVGDMDTQPAKSNLGTTRVVVDVSGQWEDAVERVGGLVRQLAGRPRTHLTLLRLEDGPEGSALGTAFGALCQSLRCELPDLAASAIGVRGKSWESLQSQALNSLLAAASLPAQGMFDADRGTLFAPVAVRVPEVEPQADRGRTYIITGGLGGVGQMIARHLATVRGASVMLCGRTPDGPSVRERMAAIAPGSESVAYCQADISHSSDACRLVAETRRRFGPVTGVVHCAGATSEGLVGNLSARDFGVALAPKLTGARNLDFATRDEPLEHFVLFSSLVAVTGATGQGAYSFANGALEGFAAEREARRRANGRAGQTISIGWGPWSHGMRLPHGAVARLRERHGLEPFGPLTGVAAFEQAIAHGAPSMLAVSGVAERLREWLGEDTSTMDQIDIRMQNAPSDGAKARAARLILEALAVECLLSVEDIDPSAPFEDFGVDSAIILGLTDRLEDRLGPLPKTLFFEYRTVDELAAKLGESHRAALVSGGSTAEDVTSSFVRETPLKQSLKNGLTNGVKNGADADGTLPSTRHPPRPGRLAFDEPIAIIGMDGRFPGAEDLDAFWNVLEQGRDCITEVPRDRWDYRLVAPDDRRYGPDSGFRWGGFLEAPFAFDPHFFRMSRREAEMIDPQERQFLLSAYRCLEAAGYPGMALSGQSVGVFAGVMWGQYEMWGLENGQAASSFASVANRVSFTFGFSGPSIGLDTMCSSSLTAIHLACMALRSGEAVAAIAGGVNVNSHPNKHMFLCNRHFASPDGRCRTFGADGDGYVASEGVGTILLKRLSVAQADGDEIHGLILGSAINHDGRTAGYTVPNPTAQTRVVRDALAAANVAPETIGYVEAHGTGTALGDPIEVKALADAFGIGPGRFHKCAIGSVKANIGHAESAAGIAGVIKVLLQMRHGRLTPAIHANPVNPNIDFASTPFVVPLEGADWPRRDGHPRRAGVSSFGASGANAHLVIEEAPVLPGRESAEQTEHIVPLSAPTEERLLEVVSRLRVALADRANPLREAAPMPEKGATLDMVLETIAGTLDIDRSFVAPDDTFDDYSLSEDERGKLRHAVAQVLGMSEASVDLSSGGPADLVKGLALRHPQPGADDCSIADISYTLQTGREAMQERLALVVSSVPELLELLDIAHDPARVDARIRRGTVLRSQSAKLPCEREAALIEKMVRGRQYRRLAEVWCQGAVDLSALVRRGAHRRVPLPTYPFALEDCRIPDPTLLVRGRAAPLSPFVDRIDLAASLDSGLAFVKDISEASPLVSAEGVLRFDGALSVAVESARLVMRDRFALTDVDWPGEQPLRGSTDTLHIRIVPSESGAALRLGLKDRPPALSANISSDVRETDLDWAQLTSHLAAPDPGASTRFDGFGLDLEGVGEIDGGEPVIAVGRLSGVPKTDMAGTLAPYGTTLNLAQAFAAPRNLALERIDVHRPLPARARVALLDQGERVYAALLGPDSVAAVTLTLTPSRRYVRKTMPNAVSPCSSSLSGTDIETACLPGLAEDREDTQGISKDQRVLTETADERAVSRAKKRPDTALPVVAKGLETRTTHDRIPFPQALEWIEAPLGALNEPSTGSILILATRGADLLRRSAARVLGEQVVETIVLGEDDDLPAMDAILNAAPEVDEILLLISGGAPVLDPDGLNMALDQSVMPILALVRYLAKRRRPPAIRLVTQGAYKLRQEPAYPTSAMASALFATLGREYPKTSIGSIDLASSLPTRKLSEAVKLALPILRSGQRPRGAHALREGSLYVRGLAPIPTPELADEAFAQGECCLIVGGSGVVGSQLTSLLAATYGADIHWLGRQPNPEGLDSMQANVAAVGGRLTYHSADVSDIGDLSRIVREIEQCSQPLRTVIHCGMSFEIGRLAELEQSAVYEGLRAKVHGSVALLKALESSTAKRLVFMSSAEPLSGNPGWGVYAAACAFQDALAEQVDPAMGIDRLISVNWGYWSGSNRGDPNTLAAKGVYPLEAARGFDALRLILQSGTNRAAAIDVDPAVIGRMNLRLRGVTSARLPARSGTSAEPLLPTDASPENENQDMEQVPRVREVEMVSTQACHRGDIQAQVTDLLAQALRIEPDGIDPDADIAEYGVDSILVLDFVSLIEERFGRVRVDEIIEHQTVRDISDYLAPYLEQEGGLARPAVPEPGGTVDPARDTFGFGGSENPEAPVANQGGDALEAEIKRFPLVGSAARRDAARALLDYPALFEADPQGATASAIPARAEGDLQIRLVTTPDNETIEVVICGTGRPVLMLPGVGLTAPIFHNQFKTFSRDYRLIVVHAPGHGRSAAPKKPKVGALVTTLEKTLRSMGLDQPVDVVASCFGTVVAMRLAIAAPDLVRSMCLCGAFSENSDFSEVPTDGLNAKQLADITLAATNALASDFDALADLHENAERLAEIRQGRSVLLASQKAQPSVGMRYLNDVLSLKPTEWLGAIEIPISFVSGTHDSIVGPNAAHELLGHTRSGRVVEIEGAGHYPFLSHPDLFDRALREHLRQASI